MNTDGFILLESLVSLAIISFLILSVFGMVQNLNTIYADSSSEGIAEVSVRLSRNPRLHLNNPNLRLIKSKNLKVGQWNVYEYLGAGGRDVVTVFVPDQK